MEVTESEIKSSKQSIATNIVEQMKLEDDILKEQDIINTTTDEIKRLTAVEDPEALEK